MKNTDDEFFTKLNIKTGMPIDQLKKNKGIITIEGGGGKDKKEWDIVSLCICVFH